MNELPTAITSEYRGNDLLGMPATRENMILAQFIRLNTNTCRCCCTLVLGEHILNSNFEIFFAKNAGAESIVEGVDGAESVALLLEIQILTTNDSK